MMIPYFKDAQKLISRNASDLLLVGGVGCILAGGILGIKQTPKALKIAEKKKNETTMEKVKAIAPLYIPPVLLAGVGITQIVFSRNITNNKLAAVATAYTASESAFRIFKEKVKDSVDPEKYDDIRREVAAEKLRRDPIGNKEVMVTSKGNILIYDSMSGRYFRGSTEEIDRAVNVINKRLRNDMTIQLNDFYIELGINVVKIGCELGWDIDKEYLEVSYSSSIADNGEPCLVIDYEVVPIHY